MKNRTLLEIFLLAAAILLPGFGCASGRDEIGPEEEGAAAVFDAYENFNRAAPQIESEIRQFASSLDGTGSVGKIRLTVTDTVILGTMKRGRSLDDEMLDEIRRYVVEKYREQGIGLDAARVQVKMFTP